MLFFCLQVKTTYFLLHKYIFCHLTHWASPWIDQGILLAIQKDCMECLPVGKKLNIQGLESQY